MKNNKLYSLFKCLPLGINSYTYGLQISHGHLFQDVQGDLVLLHKWDKIMYFYHSQESGDPEKLSMIIKKSPVKINKTASGKYPFDMFKSNILAIQNQLAIQKNWWFRGVIALGS